MKREMPRNRLKKLALFVALLFVLAPMVQAQVGAIRTLKDLGTTSTPSGCHSTYEVPVRVEEKVQRVEIDDALQAQPQNGMPYFDQLQGYDSNITSTCFEQ